MVQTIEGVNKRAHVSQDNVLLEYPSIVEETIVLIPSRYECAILLNKLYEVPVFPVFCAEIEMHNNAQQFNRFNAHRNVTFSDLPHKREKESQKRIDELRYEVLFFRTLSNIFLI